MTKCPSCGSDLVFGIEVDGELKGYLCTACNYKMTLSKSSYTYEPSVYDTIREIQKVVKGPTK